MTDDQVRPARALDEPPISIPDEVSAAFGAPRPRRALPAEEPPAATLTADASAHGLDSAPDRTRSTKPALLTPQAADTPEKTDEPTTDPTHEERPTLPGKSKATLPPKRRRKKRRVVSWALGILALILAIVLGIGCLAVWRGMHAISEISRDASMTPNASERPARTINGPITFLLLGADTRPADDAELGGDPGRSDTIIIGYVPKNRQHLYLISVPRDTWVPIPRHSYAKINAAYAWGGVSLAWETIEKTVGVRLEHAAIIDFNGFMHLTDALGGVTVYNPIASDVWFCHYPQGTITIQGECALYYVRQREDLPNGDFDRMERQRAVIRAIVSKALSGGILTNPSRFNDFLTQVSRSVTVDPSLTDNKIRDYALSMRINSGSDIRTLTMPMGTSATSPDGQWIEVIDPDALAELTRAMRNDDMDAYYLKHKADPPYTQKAPDEIPYGPSDTQSASYKKRATSTQRPTGSVSLTPTPPQDTRWYPSTSPTPTASATTRPS